jgi:hypothetical protein
LNEPRRGDLQVAVVEEAREITNNLEIQFKLASHRRSQTIEELTDLKTADVVLHIAWIEMIRDIEDDDARSSFLVQFRNIKTLQDRRVERQKNRKAVAVAHANEIEPFIHQRKRKT